MTLIFLVGLCQLAAFTLWAIAPGTDDKRFALIPLVFLGISISIYININVSAMAYVVPSKMVGTAMGL